MASLTKSGASHVPMISAADVRRISGPLDDDVIADILRVGASVEEIEIATRYARGEGDLVDRAGHPLSGRAAQVYEILNAVQELEDEPR